MNGKRKDIIAGGAFLILLLIAVGFGHDNKALSEGHGNYTIKFAHVVTPSVAKGKAAEKFAEMIEERTDGQIKVEVYPDSQLGSDREIIEHIQTGTVQMNAPFTGVLPTFVKEFEIFDLPFLFESREEAYQATNGELGEILGEKLKLQGLHLLNFWDGGFKHLTNSVRPIETPKDISGLKMRISQSPLLIAQFQEVNAGGVSIDFSELYTALQTKTVDGQENPLSNVVSKKFYEVQDYLTLSGHGYMAYPLVISSDFYNKLPEDLQVAIDEVAQEVTDWQWEEALKDEEEYMKVLNESNIQINELSSEQKKAFREAMSGAYDQFSEMEGSNILLNIIDN
ncbi:TRAP transporter substrate-binding protein [Oceanobacillus profundus]|uniref:TRAP transporter substrate-binding protein n=1 Tax=Oceanobacillus profundus TaxID=372463 RepID=A0A417YCC3_9BACI|nr:TRAP transporter substrate-binding protein [Oceanobacillus profundus]MCM3399597.1 TRAP transporter substrate-binding protein [Oceanobacillus profundus]MDO6450969.1 TRAP transporter substrate-binding protein [Oceanobacillus profundus]PAE27634.1 C4-dicarboxylate ABC transporter substrate-binding protein [Paenibacillus sp. 7884-2]RHW30251.1 TRAP transporter substrate-binding protein [Oceanobacillus profundus]